MNSLETWAPFWILGGSLGPILGALGSLGHLFGSSGGRLGSILGALGVLWAPFWVFWGSNGWLWGSLGPPLAAQGAQSEIYPIFSLPFGGHFWSILEVKNGQNSDAFFDGFVSGVFVVLGWIFGISFEDILEFCWYFLRHGENSKNRTACRREHQNRRLG